MKLKQCHRLYQPNKRYNPILLRIYNCPIKWCKSYDTQMSEIERFLHHQSQKESQRRCKKTPDCLILNSQEIRCASLARNSMVVYIMLNLSQGVDCPCVAYNQTRY